jgi:hypothetical protein
VRAPARTGLDLVDPGRRREGGRQVVGECRNGLINLSLTIDLRSEAVKAGDGWDNVDVVSWNERIEEPPMQPHVHPPGTVFPTLPIVTPDPPKRRSQGERFGALFYLGIAGLVVMAALVGWFAWSAWSLRTVWANVYALHDEKRSEAERIQAAYELSRDPRVNARQLWDIALERPLPPLARYLVAEALPAEAVEADPRGYILSVARSEGWPGWLRVLLARPIAYYAAVGYYLPGEPLAELASNNDSTIVLWAKYAQAVVGDREAASSLRAAVADGPNRGLAEELVHALDATSPPARFKALDAATLWLRDHHPDGLPVWSGWRLSDGRITAEHRPSPP